MGDGIEGLNYGPREGLTFGLIERVIGDYEGRSLGKRRKLRN